MARDERYVTMINSMRWQRLRRQVLSEHPVCQRCEQEGRATAATEVHHVNPVEDGCTTVEMERRMFNRANLMALCHGCHVAYHTEMGQHTKAEMIARNKDRVEEINRRFFE